MFTFVVLVIVSIVIFDKIRTMKSEIEVQKNFNLTLREKILKLEEKTEHLMQLSNTQVDEATSLKEEKGEKIIAFISPEEVLSVPASNVEILTYSEGNQMPPTLNEEKVIKTNEDTLEQSKPIPILFSTQSLPESSLKETPSINLRIDKKQEQKKPLFEFNSENWVGINLLNRLGALLIVIGAIATAAFDGFPSWVRSLILFAFASSVIILGEMMNRKKPSTASMGVTAVGVALSYIAVATSYFVLGTLGMYTALLACVIATLLGIYLATRYDEQVVACFALVGGYLPIFALDPFNDALTLGLVIYFVLLATFSLSLALSKKWIVSNFIGLFLAISSTTYLGFRADPLIALIYACFAFLVYTVLPLVSAYRTNRKFAEADVVLIIINAFVSSIVVFLIATRLNMTYVHTYLSVAFGLIYIGLAQLIRRVYQHKNMETIFTLKAIAFCFLFVPFTFDYRWFAVAWLIEAVVLMGYGILRKQSFAEYSGLSILGMAVISFIINSVLINIQFTLDYTFFSLGSLIVLGFYIFKVRQFSGTGRIFKWFALGNFWFFIIYLIGKYVHMSVDSGGDGYTWAFHIIATLVLAVLYVKVKWIADVGTFIIANVIHAIMIPFIWTSNFDMTESIIRFEGMTTRNVYWGVVFINFVLILVGTVMIAYFRKKVKQNRWTTAYLNIWLITCAAGISFLADMVMLHATWFNFDFALSMQAIFCLIILTIYLKMKVLTSPSLHVIANIFHGISVLMLWVSTIFIFDRADAGGLLFNLLIILISFAGVVYYEWSHKKGRKWVSIYKNMMLVNAWGSLLYILGQLMNGVAGVQFILIILTFIIAFVLKFIPLYDKGTKIVVIGMQMIGLVWLLMFNVTIYESMFMMLSLNVVAQLAALFTINELIKNLRTSDDQETPFKMLILAAYLLLVVTQGVMVQGQVAFTSAIISIIFGISALIWIVLGLYLKNTYLRKFGLYLAIIAAAKLLILLIADILWGIWGLTTPMRIISFLTLGGVLMIISFMYQKFSKNIVE